MIIMMKEIQRFEIVRGSVPPCEKKVWRILLSNGRKIK